MSFVVVIPARYQSSRLPGKPLADIHGKPMIAWVVERAKQAGASQVIVAVDDERVAAAVSALGVDVCMTGSHHQSGTERLAEVCEKYAFAPDTIIVNVQGDEPLIPPAIITQVADNLANTSAPMATLAVAIEDEHELFNPNAVKVVMDKQGYALYFSRATIPWDRDGFAQQPKQWRHTFLRHIGIYAYRAGFIRQYVSWPVSPLEQIESLEQLRVLWHSEKIHVAVAAENPPAGVDTAEDLEKVRRFLGNIKSEK
ncbi:3-deoxy-D-manno-octulosonate cytidylyltransferase [Tolumonas auensis DSM 9187]|uniref:3-deoxy-manno-octulosonate cytidylyltransferase n=1 Tax=Tolumonas auensis (strain DSM 9187 / NBRC 110442 / TA 4) TaxID=595494 RepID=KDSB_TOLAT|nr:3-deoxy-manno-octulosonate cytidylyltransferase [Tolumonas auensis]C4L8W0.1 RecName: Full=3-deoxy-manno-octulosonate cytidylyltransferase; AltName: Full=CMP-2-keto-3-deoxyoctulosonic acid synthase; Short=CKS; Short=CMP-KDO synthase [Tolumonas auensis DSM 9187]ACQ93830.1 3-deoxy-D-manno-octulosonate cytidylyltransferase [Tolumonas auensis DSM 9187]